MNQSKLEVITLANNKDTDNTMNQSKLEEIARSWRKARENECDRDTIRFGLLLIGWKVARVF